MFIPYLSESEKLEYQDWLDSLDEEARAEREENERLLQMAQQAAEDEEYFNATSAYEMRF